MRLGQLGQAFVRSAAYERRFLTKNHWDFSMVVWIPLATVLLVWWIFSQTQITDLPIGVIDQDNSAVANTAVRYLEASPTLTVRQLYYSQAEAEAAILQRDIYAVVIIPEDFSRNILSNKPAPLILQVNAQYGTHSGIIQAGVQAVASTISAGVEIKRLVKQGVAQSQAMTAYTPISIQRISLFNAATNYQQFLASTVIPALLHILAMVVGATTIGRELRDKNIGRWYRFIDTATPDLTSSNPAATTSSRTTSVLKTKQGGGDLTALSARSKTPDSVSISVLLFGLLGKYCWPILAYSLWSALILWLANPNQTTSITSLIAVYIGLLCLITLSFWLGAIFTLNSFSLRMGLSTTGFISAPSYAFAGVTFPYIAISDSAQYWSNALPLTHYLKLHIAQLQMQAPIAVSLPIVYGLGFATITALLLTTLLTKRALTHPERWGAR
ncbi:ABC transporter permease [Psychrobacter sp. SWN149]|uniref:ABC transporter permease n=1 Tax=Psychrobacter sp. SWN149 TaxID=2792057 RepID=UPI0018CFDCDC|nr:ABC transporter permease [Psychrobacter sp. SWN149]MBH0005885.1 ABC transporter permease [Psychrobacter sp. SWN149]